tara:strand:+ start:46 stop:588 length:543 start_codon:yes stop_codon:yes gene_type:complete
MSTILSISDFTGEYYIANNPRANNNIESIIASKENEYLINLLGIDEAINFTNNLVNGIPTNANYLIIYNPFEEVVKECLYGYRHLDQSDRIQRSKGLKETLKGLIYYDILSRDNYKHTLTGVVVNNNDNSNVLTASEAVRFAESKRNNIIESYNLISKRIKDLEIYSYSDLIEYSFLDLM